MEETKPLYPTMKESAPLAPIAAIADFNFSGKTAAANRLFLLGKGVKFFELPARKGCGVNENSSSCALTEGCEWTQFLLPEFNFCRPIREKSEAEDAIERAIRRSQDIIGFTPTNETLNLLASQTYESVVDDGKKAAIMQERALAGQIATFVVNKISTSPSWATEQFPAGGCGTLDLRSFSIDQKTPITGGASVAISPGDVIIYGYGTDYNEFSSNKFTRKWVIYLGRFPTPDGRFEDWGVMADGENFDSAEMFVRDAIKKTGDEPYSYNLVGMVRPIKLESMAKSNMIQRDRVNIPASDKRSLMDIVMGSLSAVGIFTFQLARSNSQHFAMYVVTGKWTSEQAERYTEYIQSSRPGRVLKLGFAGGVPQMPVVEPTRDLTKNGEFCTFKSPLKCLFKEDMEAYSEFEAQEIQLEIYQTSLKELMEKGKPIKQMYLPMDIFERITANWEADVNILKQKLVAIEEWLNGRAKFLTERLNEYLLIKTEGRYFCWQRRDFIEIITKQVISGHVPHDPVLMHAVSPEDYTYITGAYLSDELNRATMQKIRAEGEDTKVVKDGPRSGAERRGRSRRGIPYTTRKQSVVSPITLPLEQSEKERMIANAADYQQPGKFFTEAPVPGMFVTPSAPPQE